MTSLINVIVFCTMSLFASCTKDQLGNPQNETFQQLDPKLYFQEDPFESRMEIYGRWKFITSYGGFMGNGYPLDFDYLLLKPNGLFGIQRNDSLISYGYLDKKTDTPGKLIVNFKSHDGDWKYINLLGSDEKTIELTGDSLLLRSPCCDMYDELFVKD